MFKKLRLLAAVLLITLITASFASAGYSYNYPDHNYGYGDYRDSYKRTSRSYDTQQYTNYYSWGNEKTTLFISKKTVTEKYPDYYNDYKYQSYHSPKYQYSSPSYSDWRYKEPYMSDYDKYYYNTYTKSYYYEPRYDYQKDYYNWKY